MRRTINQMLVAALVSIAIVGFATLSQAGITGSEHDFSGDSWSNGQICLPCHTPHNADTTVAEAPLWNHEVTTATYTLYSSPTFDATPGQPGGNSKLCLSCHDGTVAIDSFGGAGGTPGDFISGGELVGTDLSDDHPISITYDAALVTLDGGLADPTTASSGLGGTIDADLLFNAQMECASCHDVHDDAGNSNLLVVSNASSALCLTCHNK